MEINFFLDNPFDLGSYLYERGLTIIPGSIAEVTNGCTSILTVECTSLTEDTGSRYRFTFWTYKQLNSDGGYDIWLQAVNEEKIQ